METFVTFEAGKWLVGAELLEAQCGMDSLCIGHPCSNGIPVSSCSGSSVEVVMTISWLEDAKEQEISLRLFANNPRKVNMLHQI